MQLARLVYTSAATKPFNELALDLLSEQSAIRNQSLQLTGFLTYHLDHFFQYLEGPQSDLEAVWESIRNDPRHDIQAELWLEPQVERLFPTWHMRYLNHLRMQTFFTAENIAVDLVEHVIGENSGLRSVREWKMKQIVEVIAQTMHHD